MDGGLRRHAAVKDNAGAGACIGSHGGAGGFGGQIRIRISFHYEVSSRLYLRILIHCGFRTAGDTRGDKSAIHRAGKRHRGAGQRRLKTTGVVRSDIHISGGSDARIFPYHRLHFALIIPSFFGALDGNAAGKGRAYDGALHLMIRRSRHFYCVEGADHRFLPGHCLGRSVCMHHGDRCPCRGNAGGGVGGGIGDREFVVSGNIDGLRIHLRSVAYHGKGPFIFHIRRFTLECSRHLAFDVLHRIFFVFVFFVVFAFLIIFIGVVSAERFTGSRFVDFLARPFIHGSGLITACTGLSGEEIRLALGAAKVVDRNTAGETDSTHRCRDGFGGNPFHVILRSDCKSAIGIDFVVISQVRIGLCADDAHVHGSAQRTGTGCGACHHAGHLVDGVRRFDRNVSGDILLLLMRLVERDIITGVRLGDGVEIHHVHRAGKARVETAGALDGVVGQGFFIFCFHRRLSSGLQNSGASYEGFGVFMNIRHAHGRACASTARADSKTAIAAFERSVIFGSDRNAFALLCRTVRADAAAGADVGFRNGGEHIDADGAIHARRTAHAAGYGGIGHVGGIRSVHRHFRTTVNGRTRIGVSIRISGEGNSGIAKPHASSPCDACRRCFRGLREIRRRGNRSALRRRHLRQLAHVGIGGMGHESFRSSACHAGGAAGPKTIGKGLGLALIRRFHSERIFLIVICCAGGDSHAVANESRHLLVHHFDSCRETHAGCTTCTACASCGSQSSRVFRGDGNILRRFHSRTACAIFAADEGFGVCRNIMGARRTGAAKFHAACQCGCDGGEVLGRNGTHIHLAGILQRRRVANVTKGVTCIFLHVHRRADAAPQRERHAAGETEEFRRGLGADGDVAVFNVIDAFPQIGIGGLGNHIHCDGAGAGELAPTSSKANRHSLSLAVACFIGGRTIVCIVGHDGQSVRHCAGGLSVRFHLRFIHHDGNRSTSGIISNRRITHTESGAAVISCVHGELLHVHRLVVHVGIGVGGNPISCTRKSRTKSIGCRAGRHYGGDVARFFRAHLHVPALRRIAAGIRAGPGDGAAFHIRIGAALDEVHCYRGTHCRALAAAGKGYSAGIGINLPVVLSGDRHGFIGLHRAVLHVSVGGIVHPIQRDLSRHGGTSRCTAAADGDVQDLFFIVCRYGKGLVDILTVFCFFFISGQGEICFFHIGFVLAGDGIVHESPCNGRALLLLLAKIQGNCTGHRLDGAVISRGDGERTSSDSRASSAILLLTHVRTRRIADAVH